MNLLINAGQAIEDQGTVEIRSFVEDATVHVQIADTGKGIPPDLMGRVFDPGVIPPRGWESAPVWGCP